MGIRVQSKRAKLVAGCAIVAVMLMVWSLPRGQATRGSRAAVSTSEVTTVTTVSTLGERLGERTSDSLLDHRFVIFCGTRPEIIKVAPVALAFKSAGLRVHVVFTGQHPDIATSFKEYFKISFDTVLEGVFTNKQTLSSLVGKLLLKIEQAVKPEANDVWIVQGDTSSALAAGMVAFYQGTPLIHLEAGLRTYDHFAPFPEEVNRVTLSNLASLHIAPSQLSVDRLLAEGVQARRIALLGNTGIDAVRLSQNKMVSVAEVENLTTNIVLVTLHRRENADRMDDIYDAIGKAAVKNVKFVVSVHPNPVATLAANRACREYTEVICMKPFEYGETQWMLNRSLFILTDSGGLQEEATWYGKPLLVLRDVTERTEAIDAGSSLLVSLESLSGLIQKLSAPDSPLLQTMGHTSFPFGDGHTSNYLIDLLKRESTWKTLKSNLQRNLPMWSTMLQVKNSKLPGQISNSPTEHSGSNDKVVPLCSQAAAWEVCAHESETVDVILTVWNRDSLLKQLNDVAEQTITPSHVWIIRNMQHTEDFDATVNGWTKKNAHIPVDVVASTTNTKFHGRFHVAYFLSESTYVSIWDDDVAVSSSWLKRCIAFSKSHRDALVGGNGRTIDLVSQKSSGMLGSSWSMATQGEAPGLVDFVGHSWTLKREFLRYFLGSYPYTTWTGEDIQLSAALQQHGIETWLPDFADTDCQDIKSLRSDVHASHKKPQEPRQWLLCKIVLDGFQPQHCKNCNRKVLESCINHYSKFSA